MYTEVLRSIDGIGIFPVISLVVFVTVFAAMLFWVLRLGGDRLSEFSHMPLDASGDNGRALFNDRISGGSSRDTQAR